MEQVPQGTAPSNTQPETESTVGNPSRRKVIQGAIGGAVSLVPALAMAGSSAAAAASVMPDLLSVTPESASTVRITIPVALASDLTSLQAGIAQVAERLGCPKCASGVDCNFWTLRQLLVENGSVRDSQPLPKVFVSLPREVTADLAMVQKAIGQVVARLGCSPCCSGFDIFFRQEIDALQVDNTINISGGFGPDVH
jgi:hypothetical protein